MNRTTFQVEYATDRNVYPNTVLADVEFFYLGEINVWFSDDDLARTLMTILENELRQPVYLISWGVKV